MPTNVVPLDHLDGFEGFLAFDSRRDGCFFGFTSRSFYISLLDMARRFDIKYSTYQSARLLYITDEVVSVVNWTEIVILVISDFSKLVKAVPYLLTDRGLSAVLQYQTLLNS